MFGVVLLAWIKFRRQRVTLLFDERGEVKSTIPMRKREGKAGKEKSKRKLQILGFYGYLANYKKTFYPALLALFVTAALSLAFPYFLSQLIGGVEFGNAEDLLIDEVKAKINGTICALVGVLALQAFVSYWRVRGFIKAGESALNDLSLIHI